MKFIEYFDSENKELWLEKIKESDWGAAHFLHAILSDGSFHKLVGEKSKVLMLTDEDNLVSFCSLAEKDDVQPTDLTPWIGWVYTFPAYRGQRLSGKLLQHAEKIAKSEGAEAVHISTNHVGLYEKFGYEFFEIAKDIEGEDTRVYRKKLI